MTVTSTISLKIKESYYFGLFWWDPTSSRLLDLLVHVILGEEQHVAPVNILFRQYFDIDELSMVVRLFWH